MAGLNWVRVDAALPRNHKTLSLLPEKGGDRALLLFIFGLGYCAEQGVDGFIPTAAIGVLHGTPKHADMLVAAGFWDAIPGGWNVHDYAEYQPSDEESKARSDKARKAANARWAKARGDAPGSA